MSEEKKIVAYKGFDKNMQCRDFQFEVGKTYKHEGEVSACKSGFHSCTNPLDVLNYYDVTSRFALVEIGGITDNDIDDTKIASAEITIKDELHLPEFITDCINFIKDVCKSDINSTSSGDYSQHASSGDNSQHASSGYYSQHASSGYNSQHASSGYYSQHASSGDKSQHASSGYYSKHASSGEKSQHASSGDKSQHELTGSSGIACCAGVDGKIKLGKNCTGSLARWVESEKRYRISVAYEGENGIKADTWYQLNDAGEFIECN